MRNEAATAAAAAAASKYRPVIFGPDGEITNSGAAADAGYSGPGSERTSSGMGGPVAGPHALPDGVGHGTHGIPVDAACDASTEPVVIAEAVEEPAAASSTLPSPKSATAPAKPKRPLPISKLTGERVPTPCLQPAEFLRMHGLNPQDWGVDLPTEVWGWGPDPREVLSRDESKMTAEEYKKHRSDVKYLLSCGINVERDDRPVLQLVEAPGVG